MNLYQKMWSVMETYGDTVMMFDNKQGVDRVKKEREAYAFFMESSTIEYEVQRNCDLTEVGAWLDNKAYGIAMPFSECCYSPVPGNSSTVVGSFDCLYLSGKIF